MKRLHLDTIHDFSERELLVIRQEVDNRKKRAATSWLLWFFLGNFGAHYLYLGHYMTGFIRLFGIPIAAIVAVIVGSAATQPQNGDIEGSLASFGASWGIFWAIFALWLIWWVIDIFLISGMLKDNELKVQEEVMDELRALRQVSHPPYYQYQGYQQTGVGTGQPTQHMPQQPVYQCPSCGVPVAFGAMFCGSCRTQLNWPTR